MLVVQGLPAWILGGCVPVETGGPAAAGAGRPRTGRQGAGRCGPVAERRELSSGSRVPSPWQLLGVEAELLRILKNIWGREEQEREPQAGPVERLTKYYHFWNNFWDFYTFFCTLYALKEINSCPNFLFFKVKLIII